MPVIWRCPLDQVPYELADLKNVPINNVHINNVHIKATYVIKFIYVLHMFFLLITVMGTSLNHTAKYAVCHTVVH